MAHFGCMKLFYELNLCGMSLEILFAVGLSYLNIFFGDVFKVLHQFKDHAICTVGLEKFQLHYNNAAIRVVK